MTKDKLRSEINDLEDKIEELEDLLSDALIDKEHFEQQASYLEDALDESQDEVSFLERDCSVLEDKVAELQDQLDECESLKSLVMKFLWKFYTHSLNLLTKLKKN